MMAERKDDDAFFARVQEMIDVSLANALKGRAGAVEKPPEESWPPAPTDLLEVEDDKSWLGIVKKAPGTQVMSSERSELLVSCINCKYYAFLMHAQKVVKQQFADEPSSAVNTACPLHYDLTLQLKEARGGRVDWAVYNIQKVPSILRLNLLLGQAFEGKISSARALEELRVRLTQKRKENTKVCGVFLVAFNAFYRSQSKGQQNGAKL